MNHFIEVLPWFRKSKTRGCFHPRHSNYRSFREETNKNELQLNLFHTGFADEQHTKNDRYDYIPSSASGDAPSTTRRNRPTIYISI
jgi:hypothetical protein